MLCEWEQHIKYGYVLHQEANGGYLEVLALMLMRNVAEEIPYV